MGYEGLYEINSTGGVKSLPRTIVSGKGYSNTRLTKEILRKPNISNDRYWSIILHKHGKEKRFLLHRLIAIHFIPNPNNYPEVNHKDENKLNNDLDNLEWCTRKYNTNYGTCPNRMGLSKRKAISQYTMDGEFIKEYEFLNQIKDYGYEPTNASRVANGLQLHHRGYKWRYTDE